MKVMKFGGTSVGTAERVNRVADLTIQSFNEDPSGVCLVLSAIGGITDMLIDCAKTAESDWNNALEKFNAIKAKHFEVYGAELQNPQAKKDAENMFTELYDIYRGINLVRECSLRTMDLIVSFGERLSARLMTALIGNKGFKATYVDARNLVRTEKRFNGARVFFASTHEAINQFIQQGQIYVITGFIASCEEGITTNLGRGGSDYSAAIIAAALHVEKLEIWTDVDGFMSADPRLVPDAFVLPRVSYEEAMEMSYFGAKVIHPQTLVPAIQKNIPVLIKNTLRPKSSGTIISKQAGDGDHPVKGIASFAGISLINVQGSGMVGVPGVSGRLFATLAKADINVIMISQASSEHSICFVVKTEQAQEACEVLKKEFESEILARKIDTIEAVDDLTMIAAVGENMHGTPGIAGKLFAALGTNAVNVIAIAQGSSERNVSLVVNSKDAVKAVNVIHSSFYLSTRSAHLFIMGTGNIGKTLLSQVSGASKKLFKESDLSLLVCGIANVEKMVFDRKGLDVECWQSILDEKGEPVDLDMWINRILLMNLSNVILVDCTASADIASRYTSWLEQGLHIVTPNKKANTMGLDYYKGLRKLTRDHRLHYMYETTVGAGLPIINTIQSLIHSGDTVTRIEGILSGTLSFLFNRMSHDFSFSQVVRYAFENGYTEPDPRDDLAGMDVGRKLLIMAREIGLNLELDDIHVKALIPAEWRQLSMQEFWQKLPSLDEQYEDMLNAAHQENKVVRYLAEIQDGKCSVQIRTIDVQSDLAHCKATDNIVRIFTHRYVETPLLIQGPGAGREVTAAGVLADIISLAFHLN
jgi:aspartokinase/homoserine dehydrogenase 1